MDFHLHTTTMHALSPGGKTVFEKTVRGHWHKAVDWLAAYVGEHQAKLRICFEASCGSGTLYDRLKTFAQKVVVAHPGRLRLIYQSRRKNDRIDAKALAQVLLLDAVPKAYMPKLEVRAWRSLIEFRQQQVRQRTRVKNQLRSLLRQHGIAVPRKPGLWSCEGLKWLANVTLPHQTVTHQRDLLLLQLRQAQQAVDEVTRQLDEIARQHAGIALLKSIPGVGPRTAEAMLAYIDDPQRFSRVRGIGAYLGLVPCQDSSAGRQRLGHITKQGPASVRHLLVEAAWRCVRLCPQMRADFERITAGKKERRRIALIAAAHKLARVMLAMLRSGEVYSPRLAAQSPAAQAA
jgi:transposase